MQWFHCPYAYFENTHLWSSQLQKGDYKLGTGQPSISNFKSIQDIKQSQNEMYMKAKKETVTLVNSK